MVINEAPSPCYKYTAGLQATAGASDATDADSDDQTGLFGALATRYCCMFLVCLSVLNYRLQKGGFIKTTSPQSFCISYYSSTLI